MCQWLSGLRALGALAVAAGCGPDRTVAAPRPPPPSASADASVAAALEVRADPERLPLVPLPYSVVTPPGSFRVDPSIAIETTDEARPAALLLARWLGLGESRVGAQAERRIAFVATAGEGRAHGDYGVEVREGHAIVRAHDVEGFAHGAETLAQLAGARPIFPLTAPPSPPHAIPAIAIVDRPRFAWRGMHLDVARHFFPKAVVERYVDLLAFYKINVFHWHLTDDQGFRLRLPSAPELASADGSYSPDDVKEVVAFAKARGIEIVPEIEMPGHTSAILAAHPELSCTGKKLETPKTWGVFEDVLCAGNDATYALVDRVLADVAALFPSPFVHVGGDEVPPTHWARCPKCRARMAKEKVSAAGLAGVFHRHVVATLAKLGKRAVVWDEALDEKLDPSTVVMAWRGQDRVIAAATAGYPVVVVPNDTLYFDLWQSKTRAEPGKEGYLPWQKVLAFDPFVGLAGESARRVEGIEGTLWTEHVTTAEEIETLVLPRLAALADAAWWVAPMSSFADGEHHPPPSFVSRFEAQRALLDASRVRYFVDPPEPTKDRELFLDETRIAVHPPPLFPDGVVRYTTDGREPLATSPALAPFTSRTSVDLAMRLFLPNGRSSPIVRERFERATLLPARVVAEPPAPGASFDYFEVPDTTHALPDFSKLTPKHTGRTSEVTAEPRPTRADFYALRFDALFRASADGVFRIVAAADDGVAVEIDDRRVVTDDGEHPAREVEGQIALAKGWHAMRVLYFQSKGGKSLHVECEGPASPLGPCPIFTKP